MKTIYSLLSKAINLHFNFHQDLSRILVLFLSLLFIFHDISAQSIARIINSGTNDWNFHNSISDDQGNIYYCTRDINNATLNVTCMSKELLVIWSYNYNIANIEPISGMTYKNGKLYITTDLNSNVLVLILDLSGNVLFSKIVLTGNTTYASAVMYNNDILITSSYNASYGSIQINRLTPAFTTVFNKRIEFKDRDDVYIDHIRQFGDRIIFGGSARLRSNMLTGRWFFGAMDLNGNLVYLNEYEVEHMDPYPNNHSAAMDSIGPNLIVEVGYTSDLNAAGALNSFIDGVILKINTLDGTVADHLILSPQNNNDWMFFLGVKYQANNKIRVVGSQGVNLDFNNRGLLYGEIDLDFRNFQFKFSNTVSGNTMLTQFIDYDHASGRLLSQPIMLTAQGMGTCKSTNECFKIGNVVSLNKAFNPVQNSYTLVDITYDVQDLVVTRKPIQSSLTASCGVSTCEENHVIQICKQHYEFDYSAIRQNPSKLTNLTPTIANMIHDAINKKIIIDPIQTGIAMVLMETQINLFTKQLDTFKFVIAKDSLPVLDLGPDKVLCNGDSVVLSFGLDSIHWSDGSVRKSITVKKTGVYWGSFTNMCGSVADSIVITTQQAPKLNLGNDLLLCGNQAGTLSSNYDNTIWSNGGMGRNIVVNTPGKIVGVVSTACGLSFDTVEVFKFDRTSLSAGTDIETCDSIVMLNGSFVNPNSKLYSSDIVWKQIDQFPKVVFDNTQILNPVINHLSKDKLHSFELNIRIGNNCTIKDTISVLYKTCLIDSCAFTIEKNCLPNGMVELKALDGNGLTIVPKTRTRELFWDIKDGPAGRGYSVTNKNPVIVSNHTKYCMTSKLYSWRKGYPHTIEYAKICLRESCDSLTQDCIGPCQDFSFILSSCLDDYDVDNNLNFPNEFCKSYCVNSCDYIVGVFDLNGNLVDPNFYNVTWSTGETGAVTMQKGCINFNLTVEVRKGDCIWYGRYRPSCIHHSGGFTNNQNEMKRSGQGIIDIQSVKIWLNSKQEFAIYNMTGQYLGKDEYVLEQLMPGLYFIETKDNNRKVVNKFFISGNEIGRNLK